MHPSNTWFVNGGRLSVTLGYQAMRLLLFIHVTQAGGMTSAQAHTLTQGWDSSRSGRWRAHPP